MSKELVIASNRQETKVAILEDDQLVEVYFQRSNEYSLAGSIHKGRVTRVLPGMQSAFVDLGLERDTFLYVSDFFEENEDIDTVSVGDDRGPRRERGPGEGRSQEGRSNESRSGEGRSNESRSSDSRFNDSRSGEGRGGDNRRERGERPPVAARPTELPVVLREEPVALGTGEDLAVAAEGPPAVQGVRPVEGNGLRQENRLDNGDRGRGGDRRGRRSRRRRSRGQGFPDNKYAQPTGQEAEPVVRGEVAEETDAEEVAPIILPGESLAKYRHTPSVSMGQPAYSESTEPFEEEPEEELSSEEMTPGDEAGLVLVDAEEAAAIEERAEELQAAELILSHRSEESPLSIEEKLEEVKLDQPVSVFVVGDIETEESEDETDAPLEAEVRESAPVETLRTPSAEAPAYEEEAFAEPERRAGTESLTAAELAEELASELEAAEILEVEEFQRGGSEPGEYAEPGEFAESGEFEGADLEDAQAADAEGQVGAAGGEESPNGPRSASVRDQGGRSMHRVSRRMRRRRGGNRFGQQGQPGQQRDDSATPFETVGVGAAAAPVQAQSESRRESDTRSERAERVMPSITDLLKPGQELIVQIAKEPLGQKGARITSHVALPGRYVVFMPSVSHLGVSRKVESEEERQRLKRILQTHRVGTTGGFIVRTAGEGVPENEIAADMDFLYKLWLDIRQKAEKRPAPMLLHYDLDVVQRILRDQVTEEYKAIWVDNEEMYESVLSFVQRFQPNLVSRVKMYTREAPIFDAFNITQELEKALRPKVWLKSGGYIVINQTEALVAIDINTGKYVGKSNRLEDTIVKTNTEAVKEIVRQIRLRDLGGIIVVDFIDMDERKNRQKVMQALEEAMQTDKAPYKILQFNDFGLVAITRKRVKQSLERTLCAPCPYCEGAGYVKSVQTIIGEILVEAFKIRKALDRNDVLLRVHPDVAKILKANDNRYLEELEETLGRPVLVKGDAALHHEKFDLG